MTVALIDPKLRDVARWEHGLRARATGIVRNDGDKSGTGGFPGFQPVDALSSTGSSWHFQDGHLDGPATTPLRGCATAIGAVEAAAVPVLRVPAQRAAAKRVKA